MDIVLKGCKGPVEGCVVVPEGVTEIAAGAFARQRSLRLVELPSTLVSIGDEAFMDNTSLEEVALPASVTASR